MSPYPPATAPPVAPPPVWSGLPRDLQHRTVRLLARLAYAQFLRNSPLSTQEIRHGHPAQHTQGSPRPS